MIKIGAAKLIRKWGRDTTLSRDGMLLATFKACRSEVKPDERPLVNSLEEEVFVLIASADDLVDAGMPKRFDRIVWDGNEYTVQHAHGAGAQANEVIRMQVQGDVV